MGEAPPGVHAQRISGRLGGGSLALSVCLSPPPLHLSGPHLRFGVYVVIIGGSVLLVFPGERKCRRDSSDKGSRRVERLGSCVQAHRTKCVPFSQQNLFLGHSGSNSEQVYSKVSPVLFHGTYYQRRVLRTGASVTSVQPTMISN